jgi:Spy/CpxP family protein refolding chaperone
MNRFPRLFAALIGVAGLAATAMADGPSANGYGHSGWHGFAARHFQKCLASAGLSTEQQAAIDQIHSDARPTMQAGFAALKAAEEKLRNDVASGADKSVLGQDVLDKQAAMDKIKSDHKDIHDRVLSQLRPEQKSAVESCMQSRGNTGSAENGLSDAPTQ